MKVINYIFLFFCFSDITVICFQYRFKNPVNLKNIHILYSSSFSIGLNRPIMTWDHIFFIKDNVLNAFNFKKIFLFASIYYPYGDNSYLKPINAYSLTTTNYYSVFFTKDCTLKMYTDEEGKETYFSYNNIDLNLKFTELGTNCYDSLRLYYDSSSHYAAVYNLNSKTIIVFNLYDITKSWGKKDYEEIFQISMDSNIKKAIIFSTSEKILLIGMDENGHVNFWNLKGYCKGIFNSISCAYNNYLIDSFKYSYLLLFDDTEFSIIINKNILLYINHDSFITFNLEEVKFINRQNYFIENTSCVLALMDGNALVGTSKGIIHLIQYVKTEVKILDSRLLCPNQEIFSLSLNSNCTPDTHFCYIIIANCGGYLKIFEIKNPQSDL